MIYQNSTTNCTTPIPYEKGKNGNMIYSQSFHISKQESLWGCCNNSLFSQNACRFFFFHFLFCMLVTANNCKRHSTLLVTFDSNVHVKQYFLFFSLVFFFSFFLSKLDLYSTAFYQTVFQTGKCYKRVLLFDVETMKLTY